MPASAQPPERELATSLRMLNAKLIDRLRQAEAIATSEANAARAAEARAELAERALSELRHSPVSYSSVETGDTHDHARSGKTPTPQPEKDVAEQASGACGCGAVMVVIGEMWGTGVESVMSMFGDEEDEEDDDDAEFGSDSDAEVTQETTLRSDGTERQPLLS